MSSEEAVPTAAMPSVVRLVALASGAALLLAVIPSAPATAVSSMPWSSGSIVRARMYEDGGYTGAVMTVYGSTSCTTNYTTRETVHTRLSTSGWNDVISSVRDYNSCDVALWRDYIDNGDWSGTNTGYINYGTGASVPSGWNDQASAFALT